MLYIMPGYGRFDDIMVRLGKYRTGEACLYINRLDDVDLNVLLEELIAASVRYMRARYRTGGDQ